MCNHYRGVHSPLYARLNGARELLRLFVFDLLFEFEFDVGFVAGGYASLHTRYVRHSLVWLDFRSLE